MKSFAIAHAAFACLFTFILGGCATASFTQTGETYPAYEGPVKVYFEAPEDVEYEPVGIVSAQGGEIHQRADMLEAMQKKAAKHGANAIILISEENKDKFVFSAGQYGAFGSTATTKDASAFAVRIPTGSETSDAETAIYRPRSNAGFSAGAGLNALPFIMGGYGAGVWLGKERFRAFGEFYSLDIPDAFLRNGPDSGRIERAYRLTGQYFFLEDLSGPFFSSGVEYTTTSMGYENTSNRVSYDSFYFSIGFGYLLRFNQHFYVDSGLSLNARWAEENICVDDGGCFKPDTAVPTGFIGLGVNF